MTIWVFLYFRELGEDSLAQLSKTQKSLLRKGFDLQRNSPSTVSIYADECELLVFVPLLTSVSLSKNKFFDRLQNETGFPLSHFFMYFRHNTASSICSKR